MDSSYGVDLLQKKRSIFGSQLVLFGIHLETVLASFCFSNLGEAVPQLFFLSCYQVVAIVDHAPGALGQFAA